MVDRANAIFWMPQKHVFWVYFFLVDSSEVPEAISEMVHTFYVLPQQLVVRTGPNLFSTHFKPSAMDFETYIFRPPFERSLWVQ